METEKQEFVTNIISAGRITIPAKTRKIMGLKEGDLVKVVIIPIKRRQEVKANG